MGQGARESVIPEKVAAMPETSAQPDAEFQRLVRERYAGNPRAIGALGARLMVGRDCPLSPTDGLELLNEAARQNDAEAWACLAVTAAAGVGRAQSWAEAFAEEAFAAAVLVSELNAKNSGSFKDFLHGAVNDLLPLGYQLRVTRLQSNQRRARVFLGKCGASVLCIQFRNSMRTNTCGVRGDHAGGIVTPFKLRGAVGTIEIFKSE